MILGPGEEPVQPSPLRRVTDHFLFSREKQTFCYCLAIFDDFCVIFGPKGPLGRLWPGATWAPWAPGPLGRPLTGATWAPGPLGRPLTGAPWAPWAPWAVLAGCNLGPLAPWAALAGRHLGPWAPNPLLRVGDVFETLPENLL